MVTIHQTIRITTITVVICMMRRAFSLDSWMPMIFLRQKYTVTAAAKTAAKYGGVTWGEENTRPKSTLFPYTTLFRSHDAQGLLARFMDADDILAPEIHRHRRRKNRREIWRVDVQVGHPEPRADFIDQAAEV